MLAHRYERCSVLITSNLPFSKWEMIFKDPMTTAAAIDRLVHHSVILELNVPSYRAEQARKREAKDALRPETCLHGGTHQETLVHGKDLVTEGKKYLSLKEYHS